MQGIIICYYLHHVWKKTKDFLTNEKNITINKDNQILLNKLVEISSGKWSSVAPVPKKSG